MARFLDRFKGADENWEDWEDESVDWDEEIHEASAEDGEPEYLEDEYYEDDVVYEGEAYYEDEEYYEDDVIYEDDVTYEEDVVFEDGTVFTAGDYYEDDVEDAVYDDEAYYEDVVAYEDEEYYEDDIVYEDDMIYEDELYAEEDYEDEDNEKGGFLVWFGNMTSMDKIMMAAGVTVLLLAIITGVVFLNSRGGDYTEVFASVGTQLDGIDIVGDEGLLALEEATKARLAAEAEKEEEKDYGEADYNKNVTVTLKTASVQKDLKIKFVNQSSDKLIANVPFTVSVTNPEGKAETWSDDDMDGIIHKKSITPGNYKLNVNELSGDKYASYAIPDNTLSAEVRKDIAYKKVDVSDEVKNESEIDVANEEQKKPNPQQESGLEDTVEWVESTEVTNTYIEVSKSKITDPATVSKSGTFLHMAGEVVLNQTTAELQVGGDRLTLESSYPDIADDVVSETWSSSDTSVAEVDVDGVVTPVAAGSATITCTVMAMIDGAEVEYEASCAVTVVDPTAASAGIVSVDSESVTLAAGGSTEVKASVIGFEAGKTIRYSVQSNDTDIVEASVNDSGKVTIKAVSAGETTVVVKANYADAPVSNPPSAQIKVTVTKKGKISLDKNTVSVCKGNTVTVKATVEEGAGISAKSSDEDVATVEVDGKSVIITGEDKGTATVTVTAKNGDEEVSATCAVTVTGNPKEDTTSKLKDNDGNQLYVQEGDTYREAVYADYYKDGIKFFKKGETKYTGWQTIDGKVYFFDKTGKKVTGEQVIQGAKYVFDSDGVLQTGSGTMGIDVSKHNGTIDWSAVKNSGVSYVIIRCGYRGYTQGSLVVDPTFEQNIKGATAAGLKVGVYFFSQAIDEVEAVEEASFVLDAVKNYKISYPIFLDVEYSGAAGNKGRADGLSKSARTAVCKAFCETIRSGGYTAGVYANKTWLESMIDPGQLSAHKIWLAQYAATPTYMGRYDLWQYKCTGKVSGISGNVDMNLSYLGY